MLAFHLPASAMERTQATWHVPVSARATRGALRQVRRPCRCPAPPPHALDDNAQASTSKQDSPRDRAQRQQGSAPSTASGGSGAPAGKTIPSGSSGSNGAPATTSSGGGGSDGSPAPAANSSGSGVPSFKDGVDWYCYTCVGLLFLVDFTPLGAALVAGSPADAPAKLAAFQFAAFLAPTLAWAARRGWDLPRTFGLAAPAGGWALKGA